MVPGSSRSSGLIAVTPEIERMVNETFLERVFCFNFLLYREIIFRLVLVHKYNTKD